MNGNMFVSRITYTSFSLPLSAAGPLPFPALLPIFFELLRTRSVLTILATSSLSLSLSLDERE